MLFQTAYGVTDEEITVFVEENRAVKTWIQRFSPRAREGWLSGTRRDYSRVLCRFFKWLKVVKDLDLSPEELLNRQAEFRRCSNVVDRKWLLNLVLEYSRDNPDFEEYADMTKYTMFTIIKSFGDYHEVPLTLANKVYGKKRKRKNHRKQISLSQAKKILGAVCQRDRCILLIMLQSGMSLGEVLEKFGYVWHSQAKPQLDKNCKRMKIEFDERKGNGKWYFTYISRDGIHELKQWLLERKKIVNGLLTQGKKLSKSVIEGEPIFLTRIGTPLKSDQFAKQFNRIHRGRVTSHMFRKLFKTEASIPDRGISRDIVEFFMGHINGIDSVGAEYDKCPEIHEEVFEKEYAKLEPYVNIYSGVQREPLTEGDRKWMEFFNEFREAFGNNPERLEKFSRFLDTI